MIWIIVNTGSPLSGGGGGGGPIDIGQGQGSLG